MLDYKKINPSYITDSIWWTNLDDELELVCFDVCNKLMKGENNIRNLVKYWLDVKRK